MDCYGAHASALRRSIETIQVLKRVDFSLIIMSMRELTLVHAFVRGIWRGVLLPGGGAGVREGWGGGSRVREVAGGGSGRGESRRTCPQGQLLVHQKLHYLPLPSR